MPTEVILPKVDMDRATGRISRWFYKDGDAIKKGEPLFEIETDKAAMEVDAPASGTLRNVTGREGVAIAVGAPVAWIYAEGETVEAPPAEAAGPVEVGADPDVETDARSPEAGEAAALTGNAGDGAKVGRPCSSAGEGERNGVRATPLARRIARERGIDLLRVTGLEPLGRIGREDVERAANEAVPRPSRDESPSPDSEETPLHLVTLRDGDGMPIVLIHGFGSESASWRPLLAELGEGGGPIVGVDLAGHGASVDRQAGDFADLVAGVEDSLGAAGLYACHLVGHSLGGAIPLGLGAAILAGLVNGLGVAVAGIPPFIMTLGMLSFARGLCFIYTGGTPIPILNESFYDLGNGYLLGVPIPSLILLALLILLSHEARRWVICWVGCCDRLLIHSDGCAPW